MNQIFERPWLFFEFITLVVLAAMIIGYPFFDIDMELFARGFAVLFMATAIVGTVHNLAVARNQGMKLPGELAYGLIAVRAGLVVLFTMWASSRGIL